MAPIVAHKQLALVIGNASYANRPLANSVNDAQSMAERLRQLGFEVSLVTNADRKTMGRAIDQFVDRLGSGDVAFFYYSGHGMQVDGENYLIPIDFQGQSETDVRYDAHPASRIQERLEKSGAQLNILVLDACRDNPYHSASRSGSGGLAAMSPSRGTFLVFATAPGHTASDNPAGRNGLFTQYLLEALSTPGLSLNDVFDLVREKVDSASGGKQLPWTLSSVVGRFSFLPAPAGSAAHPIVTAQVVSAQAADARPDQRGCISPPAGLVGWWPGDSDASDIIGGNNPSGLNAATVASGRVLNGFQFGNSGYVEIPPSSNLANQQFTWAAWVRPDGPSNSRGKGNFVINQDIDASHASVTVGWDAADARFYFRSGGPQDQAITSDDSFPAGTFYFLTASYDGGTFRLFVDGKPQGSLSARTFVPYSMKPWMIGSGDRGFFAGGWTHTWKGVIDELQAFNRALLPAEIQAIYNAGSAGECKPGK